MAARVLMEEWEVGVERQRYAHVDIGAPYPWHLFTLGGRTEEQRTNEMKAWMKREHVASLTRRDDPRTGAIILTVRYEGDPSIPAPVVELDKEQQHRA